jgi:glycosyltransferase involved in cell wall biosynthesis
MRLAVDAHNLFVDRRGIGVFLRSVLARMLAHDDLDVVLLVHGVLPRLRKAALAREVGNARFAVSSRVPPDASVAWHPWNGTFFAAGSVPSVATIHDVVPFAFPDIDEGRRRAQQQPFERSAREAKSIVVDSMFTRSELERYLDVPSDRIAVVPLAANERFTPGRPEKLPAALRARRYVLGVGANEPRKNFTTLSTAMHRAFPANDVILVCVSDSNVAGALTLRDLDLNELRDLYRGALAFAMPSVYEGFGIPPLEAMGCGTPVIASRASSLPEVCGDAARYVNAPTDADEWAMAIRSVVGDGEAGAAMRERGLKQARRFSWGRTAEATLAVLREAATTG